MWGPLCAQPGDWQLTVFSLKMGTNSADVEPWMGAWGVKNRLKTSTPPHPNSRVKDRRGGDVGEGVQTGRTILNSSACSWVEYERDWLLMRAERFNSMSRFIHRGLLSGLSQISLLTLLFLPATNPPCQLNDLQLPLGKTCRLSETLPPWLFSSFPALHQMGFSWPCLAFQPHNLSMLFYISPGTSSPPLPLPRWFVVSKIKGKYCSNCRWRNKAGCLWCQATEVGSGAPRLAFAADAICSCDVESR